MSLNINAIQTDEAAPRNKCTQQGIMKWSSLTVAMTLLFLILAAPAWAQVVTYKVPVAASGAPDFAVKADGKNIFVNHSRVAIHL